MLYGKETKTILVRNTNVCKNNYEQIRYKKPLVHIIFNPDQVLCNLRT